MISDAWSFTAPTGRGFHRFRLPAVLASSHAAIRPSPDGRYLPQLVVSLTQSENIPAADGTPAHVFRGGSTLVVDLATPTPSIKYCIFKRIAARGRRDRIARFLRDGAADPLRARFLGLDGAEPFAALHALGVEG